jgi:Ran-binding protein 3
MRAEGVLRLILNVSLYVGITCLEDGKHIRMTVFEDGEVKHITFRVGRVSRREMTLLMPRPARTRLHRRCTLRFTIISLSNRAVRLDQNLQQRRRSKRQSSWPETATVWHVLCVMTPAGEGGSGRSMNRAVLA